MSIDVVFVEADSSKESYQELARDFSAIETPTWSLLLAEAVRAKGFVPAIIDQKAQRWSDSQVVSELEHLLPHLIVFVAYGQNPNSGTTNMIGVERLGKKVRMALNIPIAAVGTHISALPVETLNRHSFIDIALLGDGTYALINLLKSKVSHKRKIKGICYRVDDIPVMTEAEIAVPHDRMDIDLPGYAWDLIPSLDNYRAHVWHPKFDEEKRSPFAAIYTSLGCNFTCSFCVARGSEIVRLNGLNLKIQNVKPGHLLLAWDEEKDKLSETTVLNTSHRKANKIFKIQLHNGDGLKVTGEHPIFTDRGWITAENIKIDDKIWCIDKTDKKAYSSAKTARLPEVRRKISESKLGDKNPMKRPEVVEKNKRTNMERGRYEETSIRIKELRSTKWWRVPPMSEENR